MQRSSMVAVCGAKDVSAVQLYRWRTTTARRDVFPFLCLYAAVAFATITCAPRPDTQAAFLSIVPRVWVRSLQGVGSTMIINPRRRCSSAAQVVRVVT
jgi:hypothetical protein